MMDLHLIKILKIIKKIKIYEEVSILLKDLLKNTKLIVNGMLVENTLHHLNYQMKKIAINFSNLLSSLNFKNEVLYKENLKEKLGTSFYSVGVYTSGGILLNPGKLIRAMVDTLPENVELFENTHLEKWEMNHDKIRCIFKNNTILTKKIIFCTNGFLRSLNVRKNYSFPLTLTASLTRPLSKSEYESIGSPKEWGVLPIRPMGATIRMTKDRRILIRNTAELCNPNNFSSDNLKTRKKFIRKD